MPGGAPARTRLGRKRSQTVLSSGSASAPAVSPGDTMTTSLGRPRWKSRAARNDGAAWGARSIRVRARRRTWRARSAWVSSPVMMAIFWSSRAATPLGLGTTDSTSSFWRTSSASWSIPVEKKPPPFSSQKRSTIWPARRNSSPGPPGGGQLLRHRPPRPGGHAPRDEPPPLTHHHPRRRHRRAPARRDGAPCVHAWLRARIGW